ncbi:MAG: ABC transporter permease, partial [Paracoccus sp. (in: a-proteobacteria)]|nr:ABC transporter permease [Paracoccus sp. (in: a-proteobacteria)]
VWYFLALLVFYLGMTWLSQRLIDRLASRLSRGQATMAGEAMRKAPA